MTRTFWLLSVLLLTGCGSAAAPTAATGDADGSASPAAADESAASTQPPADSGEGIELAIVDYQGILDQVAAHKGKVVVMDAWSTSCPPCIKDFHNLVELHKQYGPDRVACVSLSFDYEGIGTPEEQAGRVLDFLRSQGATFTNLMSTEESDALYRKFKLAAVPAVFVYDQSGELRKRFDNEKAKTKEEAFTYEQVKQLVSELLAEPRAETAPPADASK